VDDPLRRTAELSRSSGTAEELTREEAEAILRRLGSHGQLAAPLSGSTALPTVAEAPLPGPCPEAIPGRTMDPSILQGDNFRAFLEAVPDAVVVINAAGTIVQVNSQTERLFGYHREELLGLMVEVLVPERFRNQHVADRARYFAEPRVRPMGVHLDLSGRRKDGREIPVEISLSPLLAGEQTLVVSSIRDLSERRRADARLHKLEARYRSLVEGIPAVTFMASLDETSDERELYVSPQIEALLGFSQKEWLEDPILWYSQLHSEDRSRWHEEFARTCASGEPFSSDYRFVARDGRVVWVHGEAKVVRDEDGRPLFLQGVAFDITDIKEAERELEERVQKRTQELAQSKAKLEVFAYTASHDLKEPLRATRVYTQRLQETLAHLQRTLEEGKQEGNDPMRTIRQETGALRDLFQGQEGKVQEALGYILESTDYMAGLLQDLDVYSQVGQEGQDSVVSCTRVFESVCNILRAAIGDSGATVTADPLPQALGRERELVRLFQNLINNAIKFRKLDRPVQVHVSAQRHGDAWRFSVRDNGIGIKAQHQERIFGIGQRSRVYSRSKYPGTGFGLAICKHIVESHRGEIGVESLFDQGSTFWFTLQAAPPS
jgi:PAS domain S-box-containing protein